MRLVGIIGAMEEEVALMHKKMDNPRTQRHGGALFHIGTLNGQPIVLLQSGIGKVNAAMATALLLELYQPDAVINTGSAGGVGEQLAIGDIVISTEVCHHDADATAFGYAYGQIPQMPATYPADTALCQAVERAIATLGETRTHQGLIASGDSFMADPERIMAVKSRFPALLALEMEAAAIAQICYRYHTPFVVTRALSDIAGKESPISFPEFLEKAAVQSTLMVEALLSELRD